MRHAMNDPGIRVCGNYAYLGRRSQVGTFDYVSLANGYTTYTAMHSDVLHSGTYAYTGPTHVPAATTRIAIDPNVRVRGNGTYAGFEDVDGPIAIEESVEVYEPESGLTGKGKVTEIDAERKLVYLSVDWSSLTIDEPPPSSQQSSDVGSGVVYISDNETVSIVQDSWMNIAVQPSLAYVTVSDMELTITASVPAHVGAVALVPMSSPYLEVSQSYFDLRYRRMVAT